MDTSCRTFASHYWVGASHSLAALATWTLHIHHAPTLCKRACYLCRALTPLKGSLDSHCARALCEPLSDYRRRLTPCHGCFTNSCLTNAPRRGIYTLFFFAILQQRGNLANSRCPYSRRNPAYGTEGRTDLRDWLP
ncbi:unnamed protein product [Chondrus crispus]|uniref:Uncharacterized protein n=1 Tax=Chondrus crispus TaxID=2769 RepID=R7Q8J0_CHOCR|nr:unnamed protein product [Chondrus crispus]CDF34852.1 unnamed protein product [Chondrus crispus]|eukprot:XP_005714671.1 unnamed protein product [Chondrus crispus]